MRPQFVLVSLALLAVSGCVGNLPFMGDPLEDVDRLSDVTLAEEAETVALVATPPPEETGGQGFFGRMLGRVTGAGTAEAEEPPQDDSTPAEPADAPPTQDTAIAEAAETADDTVVAEDTPGGGLFGFLRRASLVTNDATGDATQGAPTDPDQIAPMTQQAFGVIGKTCGLSRRDLGTQIADVSGYRVYDTIPNSTAPRPHYITGFDDGCARQFTAALVLTGDVGTHEVVRYQGAGRNLPYTSTDTAYEDIKARFCGVGHGQPCGRRLDALSRHTTFVTAYESFASSPVWADILLHDGEFVGVSVESR